MENCCPEFHTVARVVTMSSREIAELVESRHDSVKRTIETLSDKGVIVRPQAVDEQTSDAMGRPRTTSVYHLGKRDSLIVVAQLCPEFTARIVDRWQELEAVAAKPQHVIPVISPGVVTMSSREIAELTGKEHAHVMRDIRTMLEVLKKDASSFGGIYQDTYGREKPCFNLDRELTMTLVSGYDIQLRYRVVTRLAELEEKVAKPQHVIPVISPGVVTMSSLELVEFINGQRGEGEAELQHKNFLAKVPEVLGEGTSAKFLADLPDSYGRPRKGYRFPKREACLMAMTTFMQLYSLDTRAA